MLCLPQRPQSQYSDVIPSLTIRSLSFSNSSQNIQWNDTVSLWFPAKKTTLMGQQERFRLPKETHKLDVLGIQKFKPDPGTNHHPSSLRVKIYVFAQTVHVWYIYLYI